MTREEIFKKNFPQYVTEKGVCLSPFWDLFDAGIEAATFELNKGIIQVLTKENAELKADYEVLSCSVGDFDKLQDKLEEEQRRNNGLSDSLTKAKEIITNLVKFDGSYKDDEEFQRKSELYDKMWEEAVQFLKELSE